MIMEYMILFGRSRSGFTHSSAVVEMASKPIYAKNTAETPDNTPAIPLGRNGFQLSVFTKNTPTAITSSTMVSLIATIMLLALRVSLMPR